MQSAFVRDAFISVVSEPDEDEGMATCLDQQPSITRNSTTTDFRLYREEAAAPAVEYLDDGTGWRKIEEEDFIISRRRARALTAVSEASTESGHSGSESPRLVLSRRLAGLDTWPAAPCTSAGSRATSPEGCQGTPPNWEASPRLEPAWVSVASLEGTLTDLPVEAEGSPPRRRLGKEPLEKSGPTVPPSWAAPDAVAAMMANWAAMQSVLAAAAVAQANCLAGLSVLPMMPGAYHPGCPMSPMVLEAPMGDAWSAPAFKHPAPAAAPAPPVPAATRRSSSTPPATTASAAVAGGSQTTVMMRNLPNNYTRSMLLELLDAEGFRGRYDFVYVPHDFKTGAGLGFAFVNLVAHTDALELRSHFEGFKRWAIPSSKVCAVGWSGADQQGLAANIERYRNSSVMHESVPESCKPMIFANGEPQDFPKNSRKLWPPDASYGRRPRKY